ncbi:IS1380 family transposase [Streptomyces sp. ISL-90]|nr:IS1380 family transposase [Streptomyces sp. ISL-90]
MQFKHAPAAVSSSFDDPNLVSAAGLVPIMKLAEKAGLRGLTDKWLSVPTDKGANAGLKVASLVAGMVAGADSIDDMALLRHGGMRKLFRNCYAPSTLGSFLRSFTFGHVRQLDAVASRFLAKLSALTPLLGSESDTDTDTDTDTGYAFLNIDDTVIEVHGHQKQGAGFGYSGVRGINALLATVTAKDAAPAVVAQRLRRGSCGSPRGAARLIRDALATIRRLHGMTDARVLVRADSAFYGHATVAAAITAGAAVSVTTRMDPAIKRAIATIPDDAWETIEYTDAIYDEDTRRWISVAQVAEVPFTAFTSRKKTEHIAGRLVARRIPELNKKDLDQPTLFDTHRFHAFFTTSDLDTVTADKTHRGHAIIEQVNADLKNSALAHLPSGVFTANAAWLVLAVIAFNLTRAAATVAGEGLTKATTATIRRKLVSVPARIASSARRIRLHLPDQWPWEPAWTALFNHFSGSPPPVAAT